MKTRRTDRASKQTSRSRSDAGADSSGNYQRYLALARDAELRGNAIEAENLYQHAEHYLRQMRA